MPAFEAIELLNREQIAISELLSCIESLNRECGHIEAMISIGFRERKSGEESLSYLESLIVKLRDKLNTSICTN